MPTIPLSGPLTVYEITPDELTRPAGNGGSTPPAVAAVPRTVVLVACEAVVPRLSAVTDGDVGQGASQVRPVGEEQKLSIELSDSRQEYQSVDREQHPSSDGDLAGSAPGKGRPQQHQDNKRHDSDQRYQTEKHRTGQ